MAREFALETLQAFVQLIETQANRGLIFLTSNTDR
jgi:hypothetical protein